MPDLQVINRVTGELEIESVYGDAALELVYGDSLFARLVGRPLLLRLVRTAPFAALYGWWQRQSWSRQKIQPFIERFDVDCSEFALAPSAFSSFNDFFTRCLKEDARPIDSNPDSLVIPADGRYRFIPRIDPTLTVHVKGQEIDLPRLLGSAETAKRYAGGSMLIARLCPTDYHRFHFPCDGISATPRLINGWLYSVNPIALERFSNIFCENRRFINEIETEKFGCIQYLEVGATCVGSVTHTHEGNTPCSKGAEKGFFSFGASALILIFEPKRLRFCDDILKFSTESCELRCLMGQAMAFRSQE
ncbi:MAG: phosphatidylserine decarboxylase [Chlamydiia bacterium]|nr:phosphatidylserine decarboxylase [Chlamydiia bacterium]